jgi:hypothetical protein
VATDFCRAYSAEAFFCGLPRARRLALGYKYFTATRFVGLASEAVLHEGGAFSQSPITFQLSLLTPRRQYVDDGFEDGVAGVFIVAVFVEGALGVGGYYGDG